MHTLSMISTHVLVLAVQNPHMPVRGAMNNLHHDILTGNDELLQTKDLFLGGELVLLCCETDYSMG